MPNRFHLIRNKLSVVQGVINDLIAGETLTPSDLHDAGSALETIMRELDALEDERMSTLKRSSV